MYKHVFIAGTFDRLHKGHEAVLAAAFGEGERVTIGLTSDRFVRTYKSLPRRQAGKIHNSVFMIQPHAVRKQHLLDWLLKKGYSTKATVIPIDDPYEPAASMKDLDAIIVTHENKKRGEEINRRRAAKGLAPLALVDVPLVGAQDGKPISSTRLRNGQIDRDGRLIMPESLRAQLQQPMSNLLRGDDISRSIENHRDRRIVTVGDMATMTLLEGGVVPFLAVVDGHIRRAAVKNFPALLARFAETIEIASGPGFIAREAVDLVEHIMEDIREESLVINVTGEEDLLVLPVVACAPLGTVVYYGQPPIVASWACGPVAEGLVEVEVTQKKRREAVALLGRFI